MTDLFSAAAAIARIPGVEPAKARFAELGGGFSHRLWLVEAEERKLVLRLDTPHVETLGLDRRTELTVLRRASEAGLASNVVFADPDAGMLVYEYLPGRSWTAEDLADKRKLEALAALLRRAHALPRAGVDFDAAGAAERYVRILHGDGGFREPARRCRDVVTAIPPPENRRCCHNDVVAENVLEIPELVMLDWEYACDNEPLFDLACLIAYHDLDETRAGVLLSAYAGSDAGEPRERLERQIRLFDALQWLWLAVRQTVMPNDATRDRLRRLAGRIAL
ncbi:MAG TPA: choline/ethanolamine kinase family protein [Woeseiaceae bacterium]|nr:choline/ethanolamine kinase family protein [Woeseiaceae bacterium]